MIARYDRIEVTDGSPLMVVWACAPLGHAAVKPVDDPKAWPELVTFEDVRERQEAGVWRVVPGEMPIFPSGDGLPENHLAKRDQRWDVISGLVTEHVPGIFIKRIRTRLVSEAAEVHGVTPRTVATLLQHAFHKGMIREAMLPGWARVGNAGQPRPAREGGAKRGRPRLDGTRKGANTTPEMKRLFLIAGDHYDGDKRVDLPSAYRRMVRMFFSEVADELDGKHGRRIPLEAYAEAGLPRFETFAYYVRAERDREESMRRRIGDRVYDMTRRALLGDSTAEAWGPGARFQIDATIVDVYIRSRRDRRRLVGRPTLFVIIDVFSRMIVGFSLSFDPPSWLGAMTALANAVSDKVAFCARFGITISPEDWPCHHVPAIIEGDRGEMEGNGTIGILRRFHIDVQNAAAYRADWKGVVEQRFRLLQQPWRSYVDGYVDTDYGDRGAHDYRLDAVLDIDDLTRILIRQILHFNNDHELRKYPRLPEMTEDGVPSVPRELWRWGIANKGGMPRAPREEPFLFALLPTHEASATPQGIYYHGAHYTCPRAVREKWFTKARDKRFKVTISYDKRDADRIYVHDPKAPDGFEVAVLTPTSRRRAGSNGWEIEGLIREDAAMSADRRDEETLRRIEMDEANEADVAGARRKFKDAGSRQDPRGAIRDMRETRAAEVQADRAEDAACYRERMGVGPSGQSEGEGEVVGLPAPEPTVDMVPEDKFAPPSMRQMRASSRGGPK